MAKYYLPTELWIYVFSNLDYLTLKTGVSLTCKHFNNLLSPSEASEGSKPHRTSKLDIALFRDTSTEDKSLALADYRLHPFLLKHGFELRDGFCREISGSVTNCPDVDCKHNNLALVKEFRRYEEIAAFADTLHNLSQSIDNDANGFFDENATSPAENGLLYVLKIKTLGKQNLMGNRAIMLRTAVRQMNYLLPVFWANMVIYCNGGEIQNILRLSMVESCERLISRLAVERYETLVPFMQELVRTVQEM